MNCKRCDRAGHHHLDCPNETWMLTLRDERHGESQVVYLTERERESMERHPKFRGWPMDDMVQVER